MVVLSADARRLWRSWDKRCIRNVLLLHLLNLLDANACIMDLRINTQIEYIYVEYLLSGGA